MPHVLSISPPPFGTSPTLQVRNYEEMERAKEAAFTTFDLAIALFDEDTDDLLVANRKSDYYIPVAVVRPLLTCYFWLTS